MEASEITTVRRFLDSIERHDLPAQLNCLTPEAQAYRFRDGRLVVSRISEVLKAMAEGGGSWSAADASGPASEPIDRVDSVAFEQIATVWTHYRFIVRGEVHHRGHTIFSLVRTEDSWRIASVVDEATRGPE